MVASDFDGLRGYRTLEYEGKVPTKPYNCCFSRVFQASVCIATYGMSVPSLHVIRRLTYSVRVPGSIPAQSALFFLLEFSF